MKALPLVVILPESAYDKLMALIQPQVADFLADQRAEAAATRAWAEESGYTADMLVAGVNIAAMLDVLIP